MNIKDSWVHQILQRAHKNFKWPIKFGNLHLFEWDMGHWPILRAHQHFGLGLSLPVLTLFILMDFPKHINTISMG